MGGNLFKVSRRYDKGEYNDLYPKVINDLYKVFKTEFFHVFTYNSKESFGDLDLLVLDNGSLGNIVEQLKTEFNTKHVHRNSNVISFLYGDFQVDLILTKYEAWKTSKLFMPNDPSGNLMGKIAHRFGLKYGFDGLVYPFRNFSGRITRDIVLSKESKEIFEFLGFSYERYQEGFGTVEEIFNFIIESKYFNVDNFLMENLTHIDRKRNAKRKTYQGFLKFVEETKPTSNFEFNRDKSTYFELFDKFFPESNFLKQIDELQRKDKEMKEISEKFNGRLIMEKHPDLKGKELGLAIKNFKDSFCFDISFNQYVLETNSDKIMQDFTTFTF